MVKSLLIGNTHILLFLRSQKGLIVFGGIPGKKFIFISCGVSISNNRDIKYMCRHALFYTVKSI